MEELTLINALSNRRLSQPPDPEARRGWPGCHGFQLRTALQQILNSFTVPDKLSQNYQVGKFCLWGNSLKSFLMLFHSFKNKQKTCIDFLL